MIKEIMTRTIVRSLPLSIPTDYVFFFHGGMGDRIMFQGILREFQSRSPGRRLIAGIPSHGQEYDAHHYVPRPDEVWIIDFWDPDFERRMEKIRSIRDYAARAFFRPHLDDETYVFHGPIEEAQRSALGDLHYHEPYVYGYQTMDKKAIYPRMPISSIALESVRERRAALRIKADGAPLIALHCRQRPHDGGKNPCLKDVVRLSRLLKSETRARIILFGSDDTPPELEKIASFVCPQDPTLRLTAAWMSQCDLFIGGDSGPGHLAAAVGVPIISFQAPPLAGHFGPFCPPDKLTMVVLSSSPKDGDEPGLRFDPTVILRTARERLESSRSPSSGV